MSCLMLLTVLVSILLVISHSTPFVEPLRFEDEPVRSLDSSPISDLNQPLFDAESISRANEEISSALDQCDGSTGGLPPLGKENDSCTLNDETVDESTLTIPHSLNRPKMYTPTSDDIRCNQFLRGKFLIVDGKAMGFEWSVCDSGNGDNTSVDVMEAPNALLPGYTTYTLYDASLSTPSPPHWCPEPQRPWCCITFKYRMGVGVATGCILLEYLINGTIQ